MQREPLISIIVPVYNSGTFINRCLYSISIQTYNNIEVWCVDDGSKDDSLSICREWEKRDNRYHVVHQENKGVSCARNAALNHILGEYVLFIDSDDFIDKNYIRSFKLGYDISLQGYTVYASDGCQISKKQLYKELIIKQNAGEFLIKKRINTAPWCKLLKRSIIEDNNIRFPESLSYGEDSVFLYEYLSHSKTLSVSSSSLYGYCFYDNSLGRRFPPIDLLVMMYEKQDCFIEKLMDKRCGRYSYFLHLRTVHILREILTQYKLTISELNEIKHISVLINTRLMIFEKIILKYPLFFIKYANLLVRTQAIKEKVFPL